METKHTPGEMKAQANPINHPRVFLYCGRQMVASTLGQGEVNLANAERLALCWNNHDELVKALRAFLDSCPRCKERIAGYCWRCRAARAALKGLPE